MNNQLPPLEIARRDDGSYICMGDGEYAPADWFPTPGQKDVIVTAKLKDPPRTFIATIPVSEACLCDPPPDLDQMLIERATSMLIRKLSD